MKQIFYRIADRLIRVSVPQEWSYRNHGDLIAFLADPGEPDLCLEFQPVDRLPNPEGVCLFRKPDRQVFASGECRITYLGALADGLDGAYLCISRQGGHGVARFLTRELPFGLTANVVMRAMELEEMTARNRAFLLHASFVRWGDRAILFTAPSGTGKSTQAELWCHFCGAELMNGDRVIVRMEGDQALACGVPFCGSSGVTKNASLPLAAIVYLSQAPQTRIEPLTGYRAFRRVWEGCSVSVWDRDAVSATSQTVMDVLEAVPMYHLACTPDETAVDALKKLLERR